MKDPIEEAVKNYEEKEAFNYYEELRREYENEILAEIYELR